jgi:serine/threonine protein kinase/tetratricopeptide (TPR) repeat protein
MPGFHIGPYRMVEKIGQGGMGDVWLAEHGVQSMPIAIKVMRDEPTSSRARQAFVNEIQQVAKLDHQGIAMVYDFGEISETAAEDSGGIVRCGHPFIAIEYALRGSLDKLNEVLTWRDLVGILRALLAALAHAHSRGVLHRDIKPGNILLGSGGDLRPSIKLTDFGLAVTRGNTADPETGLRIAGTPDYMAPEQIEGNWRDQGPWTDLYSLGCVAYELASGAPPFTGDKPSAIATRHLSSPVPPLNALGTVPPGFESWLQRMLKKETYDRFMSAADADHALAQIDLRQGDGPIHVSARNSKPTTSPTWTFLELPLPRSLRHNNRTPPAMHPLDAPPIPSDWRDLERTAENRPMLSEGLNLFGLRAHRLIGRSEIRDQLWSLLQQVATGGQPKAIVLRGAAGLGKRSLARWLMETAQEAGAASVMEATHSAIPGPSDGLPRMLAKHIGCIGTSGVEVIARTEHVLRLQGVEDSYEWEQLGRSLLVTSGAVSQHMAVPVGTVGDRRALVLRFLERLAVHRPVIIHISDAQFGLEALHLTHKLLRPRGDRLPVLIVLSADAEALESRSLEMNALEQLQEHSDAETATIGPLNAQDQQALIQGLLRVDPSLAQSVAQRSGGSPLFAIQLVEDWVQRGVLQPGPDGLALVRGESAELPDTIHEVWQGRVKRALSGLPDNATLSIWTAAALGINVHQSDWEQSCAALGFLPPNDLWTRMIRAGLAQTRETGWAFSHGMLRESLERAAAPEWARINLGCANMLASRGEQTGIAERIGRHLVVAGEIEAALAHLQRGAAEYALDGRYPQATELLDMRDNQLEQLAIPFSDSRWGEGWLTRLIVHSNLRQLDAGHQVAMRFSTEAMRHGWTRLLSPAFRFRGIIAYLGGDYAEADAMLARAESFLAEDAIKERGNIHSHWGRTMHRLGLKDKAIAHLKQAISDYQQIEDRLGVANSTQSMAAVMLGLADGPQKAMGLLRDALKIYESVGHSSGAGDCWNGIADVHRQMGDLGAAHSAYQTALTYLVRSGTSRALVPILNLGLVLLKQGKHEQATQQFENGLSSAKSSGRVALSAYAQVGLMACMAYLGDWEKWDTHAQAAFSAITNTGIADRDLAWPAELAGDRAAVEGERTRAEMAWRMAIDQWTRVGAPKDAQRLERRLKPIQG